MLVVREGRNAVDNGCWKNGINGRRCVGPTKVQLQIIY